MKPIDKTMAMPGCCSRERFTYVIQASDKIKIGCADDVAVRVGDIQRMGPAQVTILGVARGALLERKLHAVLAPQRTHGEWFWVSAWDIVGPLFGGAACASCMFDDLLLSDWAERSRQVSRVIEDRRVAISRDERKREYFAKKCDEMRERKRTVLLERQAAVIAKVSGINLESPNARDLIAGILSPTDRQLEMLTLIVERIGLGGRRPTIRELAMEMGIRSTNGVASHIDALKRKGMLDEFGAPTDAGIRIVNRPTRLSA